MKMTRVMTMLLAVGVLSSAAVGQPIRSNVWTDFGGSACLVNGNPMPAGCRIDAYDPDGVLCGQQFAESPGLYRFMPVYGDFGPSPEDEGCILGDVVSFRINGIQAQELGPATNIWEGQGFTKIMNLSIQQNFAVVVTSDNDSVGYAGETIPYTVRITNSGDGIDKVEVTLASANGWTISSNVNPAGYYIASGDFIDIEVEVHIPASATIGEEDELTATATSQFNPATSANKIIVTSVDQQTDVDESDFVIPGQFSLAQNYPNPFNPETTIRFSVEKGMDVSLDIYDILGRRITNLHSGYLPTGDYEYTWFGTDHYGRQAASGIYFYRLTTGEKSLTRKMTLLK